MSVRRRDARRRDYKAYNELVRRLSSFVAIFLLLLAAAPVLACVMDGPMMPQERACCRAMHGDCGEMAKTGCCQTELRTEAHPQRAASPIRLPYTLVMTAWLAPASFPAQATPAERLRLPDEHSPPGLLIAKHTVLRV